LRQRKKTKRKNTNSQHENERAYPVNRSDEHQPPLKNGAPAKDEKYFYPKLIWWLICWPLRALRHVEADRIVAYGTLLLAIATFALAMVAHSTDANIRIQAGIMQQQLDAMVRDQRPFIWITNSPTGPSFVKKRDAAPQEDTGQIIWNWQYTNLGRTFARNLTYDTFLKIGDAPYRRSEGASAPVFGGIMPPGKINFSTAVSIPGKSQTEFNHLIFVDGGIGLLIEFVYFDGAENRYADSVCIVRIATGAVAYPDPSTCKK
jgi:hypothetical protein